jgi:cytochrome c553
MNNKMKADPMNVKSGHPFLLYSACVLLMIIILLFDLAIPLGSGVGVSYIAIVLLSLWAHKKRFTVLVTVVCSMLIIVGFYFSPPGGIPWQVIFNRVIALFAIWVTALLTLQRKIMEEKRVEALWQREKALEDVKILRGMLPICASCHKIRDDKGYWTRIERYIKDHSEADFTHGLCPECAEKLYPEIRRNMGSDPDGQE